MTPWLIGLKSEHVSRVYSVRPIGLRLENISMVNPLRLITLLLRSMLYKARKLLFRMVGWPAGLVGEAETKTNSA